jgi:hypothetical protein
VKSFHFDPFKSRLARDIRNSLSKSFLKALVDKDASIFQSCGAGFMQQNLEPGLERYVKSRLKKYEEAYAVIEQREINEVIQQAAIFWDLGLYFEMHELLEIEWKDAKDNRRRLLQGLIRAAGMKIHAENNNNKAAVSMGIKAREDLLNYGGELKGFHKLEAILAEIKRTLASSQNNSRDD